MSIPSNFDVLVRTPHGNIQVTCVSKAEVNGRVYSVGLSDSRSSKGNSYFEPEDVVQGWLKGQGPLVPNTTTGKVRSLFRQGSMQLIDHTRCYRSPEEILEIRARPSVDVWSLAIAATEVYAKLDLFNVDDEKMLMAFHQSRLQKNYPTRSELAFRELVHNMSKFQPKNRISDETPNHPFLFHEDIRPANILANVELKIDFQWEDLR